MGSSGKSAGSHTHAESDTTGLTTDLGNRVIKPVSPPNFVINGSAPASASTLPAALGSFSGTLLTDALTAISSLYTRVDALEALLRKQIELNVTLAVATSS